MFAARGHRERRPEHQAGHAGAQSLGQGDGDQRVGAEGEVRPVLLARADGDDDDRPRAVDLGPGQSLEARGSRRDLHSGIERSRFTILALEIAPRAQAGDDVRRGLRWVERHHLVVAAGRGAASEAGELADAERGVAGGAGMHPWARAVGSLATRRLDGAGRPTAHVDHGALGAQLGR